MYHDELTERDEVASLGFLCCLSTLRSFGPDKKNYTENFENCEKLIGLHKLKKFLSNRVSGVFLKYTKKFKCRVRRRMSSIKTF